MSLKYPKSWLYVSYYLSLIRHTACTLSATNASHKENDQNKEFFWDNRVINWSLTFWNPPYLCGRWTNFKTIWGGDWKESIVLELLGLNSIRLTIGVHRREEVYRDWRYHRIPDVCYRSSVTRFSYFTSSNFKSLQFELLPFMLSSFSWPKDGAVVIRTMSGWSCISARRAVAVRGCEAISTSRIDLFVFLFFLQTSRLVLSQIRFLRNCDSGPVPWRI